MHESLPATQSLARNRAFLIYTSGSAVSLVGTWMQRILTGWLAWELTGSGAWLGLVAAADLLPTVVIAPFAGAAADRWKRLTVARITQALGMLQAFTLALFFGLGMLGIELLFVLTALHGIIMAVNQPARLALIHALVGKDNIPPAVAINSVIFNVARLIGPIAAGVAIISIGIGWGFFFNALSFGVFLVALLLVRVDGEERIAPAQAFLKQTVDGLRYTVTHRGIAGALLLMAASGIGVRPITELLPGYIDTVLASDATGLVALTSALAIGAILGGLLMTRTRDLETIPRSVLLNCVGVVVAMIAFVFIPDLILALPAFGIAGFFLVRIGIAAQVYVQLAAGEQMRGRVLSLLGMIQRGGPALGALAIGFASDFVGFRWPVVFGCLALLACTAVVAGKRLLHPSS